MGTKLSDRFLSDPAPLPLGGDELIEVTIPGSSPYTAVTTATDIAALVPAQTITLTGNVTGSGTGTFAATIANDAVTYAKMQNVSATDKVLGRVTAGAGDVEEISTTGSGNVVRATSPTLVTPVLGAATGTSLVLAGALSGVTNLTTTGNTILGDASTDTLNVGNGGIVKDASGNVGIGETPPAWDASTKALNVGSNGAFISGNALVARFGVNSFYNGTNWTRRALGETSLYYQNAGTHVWTSDASGAAAGTFTHTERMRLDGSGNLIPTLIATPPTLAVNSQMVFNLTSNTNLRISVRGTDGVTRTANITLS